MMKRTNEPIFWSLFGAGGVLAALLGPILILITGVFVPAGVGVSPGAMAYPRMLAMAQSWGGKIVLFVVISLFLWHALHRIYHSLHDLGIHAGAFGRLVCYGIALLGTLIAAWALLSIGS